MLKDSINTLNQYVSWVTEGLPKKEVYTCKLVRETRYRGQLTGILA